MTFDAPTIIWSSCGFTAIEVSSRGSGLAEGLTSELNKTAGLSSRGEFEPESHPGEIKSAQIKTRTNNPNFLVNIRSPHESNQFPYEIFAGWKFFHGQKHTRKALVCLTFKRIV